MAFQDKKFNKNILAASVLACLTAPSYMAYAAEAEAQAAEEDDIEVIQVRGIRGSMIASMNNKRFAENVVDSITATDIGKLPDATIADSLQRITGVQIQRSGGEGSSVNIRGVNQVAQTLNGEQMLSAGSVTTVAPDFADIPSTMVSGLDVIKSAQASHLLVGLTGTIDLKTNRPFQLEDGWTVLGKAEVSEGSMSKETDPSLSGFVGYNNEGKFGATFNVSYQENTLADYIIGSSGDDWGNNVSEAAGFPTAGVDATGDDDSNDVIYGFQGHQASNNIIERERLGVNGSVQWQLTDELKLTGDVFYTKMDEYRLQGGFFASNSWKTTGWFIPDEVRLHPNIQVGENPGDRVELEGNYASFQSGTLQAYRTMVHSETDAIEKEALNTNLELEWDNGDNLVINARWVHGEARNDNALSVADSYINSGSQVDATFKGPGGEVVGDVNPWGYDGDPVKNPDGTVVDDPDFTFTQIPIGIQYTGSNQIWTLPTDMNIDGERINERFGSNINRYSATSLNLTGQNKEAELDVFRVDVDLALDFDLVPMVKFGARYGIREVEQEAWLGGVARTNEYGDAFLSRWKDSASQAPETKESFIEQMSFAALNERGYIAKTSDFQGAKGLGSLYYVDPHAMKNPLGFHNAVYGQNIQAVDGANTYDLEEKTTSFYMQANLEGEFGLPFTGNVGFKYIKTEYDINQTEAGDEFVATYNGVEYLTPSALGMIAYPAGTLNTTRDYDDYLPSVNLAFEISDEQKLRFAFNKAVTTHNTNDLAGGITITRTLGCELRVDGVDIFCVEGANEQGNPNLDPWRSTNYDVSYEWYFSETGMFNVGAFYMDIDSFTQRATVRKPIPDSDGVVRGYDSETKEFVGDSPVTTITNSDGGSIKGLEVGLQAELGDFIDSSLVDGFGITTNYTYSPSESGNFDYYGDDTPMVDNSEHQSNFALWYEKDGLQARIAHNYRSKMYLSQRTVNSYTFAKFQKPTHYIDASVSYDINDTVTVMLQGTNLTEEHQERYFQWEDLLDKRFINERRVTLGVQVKM